MKRRRFAARCPLSVALLALLVATTAHAGPQFDLSFHATGVNGVGSITQPGLSCLEGGHGSYRHYFLSAPLPANVFSKLRGEFNANLDVHFTNEDVSKQGSAFLLGDESHATLSNARGGLQLRLSAGSCGAPALTWDGTFAAGAGTWNVLPTGGTGSYRAATGSGQFAMRASLAPGADNPWSLAINGKIAIAQPSLKIEVERAYWGNLGLDYAFRIVSVDYKITNTGPGDSYGAKLLTATSPTPGVTPLGPVPQALGDLLANESEIVTLRYRLDVLEPCTAVVVDCTFDTVLAVDLPDALDEPHPGEATVSVTAPLLPPPLEDLA